MKKKRPGASLRNAFNKRERAALPEEAEYDLGEMKDVDVARKHGLAYKAVRRARLDSGIPAFTKSVCGTTSSYRRGCRCDECREAHAIKSNTDYHTRQRRKGVPSRFYLKRSRHQ